MTANAQRAAVTCGDVGEVSLACRTVLRCGLGLLVAVVVALGAVGANASSAAAAPRLDARSLHLPTHFTPGEEGRYELIVRNAGDEATTGDPVTVSATVPEGMTITDATDPFGGVVWGCTIAGDGKSVTCELGFGPIEAGQHACQSFGVLCPIVLTVDVAAEASGTGTTTVEACGGGSPCDSASDPTTISATPAGFGIAQLENETFNEDLSPAVQAGRHPGSMTTRVVFNNVRVPSDDFVIFDNPEDPKTLDVDLPVGLLGDPTAAPRCSRKDFSNLSCPLDTQVGTLHLHTSGINGAYHLYNLEPPPDRPAQLGAAIGELDVNIFLDAEVRTGGDYGLSMSSRGIPQVDGILEAFVTVWGFPADSSHDTERGSCLGSGGACPVDEPRRAFLTNPTSCSAARAITARSSSWQSPGVFKTATTSQPAIEGCNAVRFDPIFTVRPTNPQPDSPSGYQFDIRVPQNDDPDGLATSHLKKTVVTLPDGVSVSPSAAHGLVACAPSQIALASAAPPTCPRASQVGTVHVETPVLDEPLSGEVYVAKQNDNPFNTLMAMYVVARGSGVLVKLPARIDLDQVNGRITATFDNNPQLPFSRFLLKMKGGPTAPLVNPPSCGGKTVRAQLNPWSGRPAAQRSASFTIACPGMSGFAPGFDAGSVNPTGGAFSPFGVRINRRDGEGYLRGVTLEMPTGLLARLKDVPLCPEAQAAAGTCGVESHVGTATVGAGPGPNPYFLNGSVSLTGPYKDAPYGLSVSVRAVAGPFDLGRVVVRQAIHVDPDDAHITVVSDPLPTIIEGIPLRLRSVNVDINRPGFMINPTSCAEKQIKATLMSSQGAVHQTAQRFQAGDCRALPVKPKMAIRLTGRRQTKLDGNPGLRAVVTQSRGQANLEKVAVKLPLTLALDTEAVSGDWLCEYEDGLRVDCPDSSVIGRAKATTPILNRPLTGPVYFVKNVRFDRNTGARIRTLPTLLIPLRGEVAIDLRAKTSITRGRSQKLVSTFDAIPDAPISRFELRLNGGRRRGILTVVNRSLCRGKNVADADIDGQNGKRSDRFVKLKVPCKKKGKRRR